MTALRRTLWPPARRRRLERWLTFASAVKVEAARPTVVLIPNRRYYFVSGMLSAAILVVTLYGFSRLWPTPAVQPSAAPRAAVARVGQSLEAEGLVLQVLQVRIEDQRTHVVVGFILEPDSPLVQADQRWWLQASDFFAEPLSPGRRLGVQLLNEGQAAGALAFGPGVGYFELRETSPCALRSLLGYQPYPQFGGFRFHFDLGLPVEPQCERAPAQRHPWAWLTKGLIYFRIVDVS